MKVENHNGSLIYDPEHPQCTMVVSSTQGQLFAFITVLDVGMPHARLSTPHQKRYWGAFSWEDQAGSIREIMNNGGKWPVLDHYVKHNRASKAAP